MRLVQHMLLAAGLLAPAGCFQKMSQMVGVEVEVVDDKTLLERQILGTYESLSTDLVMVASVRSVDRQGRLVPHPELPPGKEAALNALRVQEFYADDVARLKAEGVLGEDARGKLALRTEPGDPGTAELAAVVVERVNAAREVLLQRILETNEHLGEGDRDRVEVVFASMHQDGAEPGEWIQQADGTWTRKGGR